MTDLALMLLVFAALVHVAFGRDRIQEDNE